LFSQFILDKFRLRLPSRISKYKPHNSQRQADTHRLPINAVGG
jgi:hypothetical protein